jgi:hypothetical protein
MTSKTSYTGCALTLSSALSQAFCLSPDDRRGAGGLLPEEVRALVGITICQRSPSEATVAITAADTRQEVAAIRHAVFAIADICETVWVSWRGLFSK